MGRTKDGVARRRPIDVECGSFSAPGDYMVIHGVPVVVLLVEWKVPRCAVICRVFVPNLTARAAEPKIRKNRTCDPDDTQYRHHRPC
jgi:hypothetical protein